jgi:hypothetical protein
MCKTTTQHDGWQMTAQWTTDNTDGAMDGVNGMAMNG